MLAYGSPSLTISDFISLLSSVRALFLSLLVHYLSLCVRLYLGFQSHFFFSLLESFRSIQVHYHVTYNFFRSQVFKVSNQLGSDS